MVLASGYGAASTFRGCIRSAAGHGSDAGLRIATETDATPSVSPVNRRNGTTSADPATPATAVLGVTNLADPLLQFTTVFPRHLPSAATRTLDLYGQIRSFERITPARQDTVIASQITHLLRHAKARSPFWAERLADWRPGANRCDDLLRKVPVLTRGDIQEHFPRLAADFPERSALGIQTNTSSGSTGTPVKVEIAVGLSAPLYQAVTLLTAAWHDIKPTKSLGVLGTKCTDKDSTPLGIPFAWFGPVGTCFELNTQARDTPEIYEYCARKKPHYLQTGPSTLLKLARYALAEGLTDWRVEKALTLGSAVTEDIREIVREGLGAEIVDRYSCEEAGYIALQCPKHHVHHVVSPVTHVEIVDAEGAPCGVGQRGRVLVTSLHSYSMPLIRYEIGDMAEWGEPCDCGIRLPVIGKLWGRTRQLFTTPDGRETYGRIYARDFADIPGLLEYRFVLHQNAVVDAQLKVAAGEPRIAGTVTERIQRSLGYPYPVRVRFVNEIEWGRSWKQESFAVSDSPPPPFSM